MFNKRGDWDMYAACPCGEHYQAPFGDMVHIPHKVCPKCGADKKNWKICVARWVTDSKFWKMSTWDTGHWEHRAKAS